MPTWSPVGLVRSMRDELELANVGIIVMDSEKKAVVDVIAPTGKPTPDRQEKAAPDMKRILRHV